MWEFPAASLCPTHSVSLQSLWPLDNHPEYQQALFLGPQLVIFQASGQLMYWSKCVLRSLVSLLLSSSDPLPVPHYLPVVIISVAIKVISRMY